MTYREIIQRLHEIGVDISMPTLYRYRAAGLIPEPVKGHGGRGRGPSADFPKETPAEVYAAKECFLRDPLRSARSLVRARKIALEDQATNNILALVENETNVFPHDFAERIIALEWLRLRYVGLQRLRLNMINRKRRC